MKTLIELYKLHAPSGQEKKLRRFVRRECIARGAKCETDKHGNLLVIKGEADTYPCVCAHLDQVQRNHCKDFAVMVAGDVLYGFSETAMGQQGLGADDKNGIWVALQLLAALPALKCAFFVGEEIGCVGSSRVDLSFFKDVRYCVQADRRNGGDLITEISGKIASDDFVKAITPLAQARGYKTTQGLSTDVGELSHRGVGVSCINISCGYYFPHSDHEITKWSELLNALHFAHDVCMLEETYPHTYVAPPMPKYYGNLWSGKSYPNYGSFL